MKNYQIFTYYSFSHNFAWVPVSLWPNTGNCSPEFIPPQACGLNTLVSIITSMPVDHDAVLLLTSHLDLVFALLTKSRSLWSRPFDKSLTFSLFSKFFQIVLLWFDCNGSLVFLSYLALFNFISDVLLKISTISFTLLSWVPFL